MNYEWITDRLPTVEDTSKTYKSHVFGRVFVTRYNTVTTCLWSNVDIGEAWQPITVPEPYVKAKRCIVLLHNDGSGLYRVSIKGVGVPAYNIPTREAAERIAAIYEEVMP
jgi:hypothetical protein